MLPITVTVKHTELKYVVLCGCERSPDRLKEERRLRACENRMLRIVAPKREQVIGGWRKVLELCVTRPLKGSDHLEVLGMNVGFILK
jgi:hypothetical protein